MRRKERIAAARASCGKGKNIALDDIFNFGSGDEADNEADDGLGIEVGDEDEAF